MSACVPATQQAALLHGLKTAYVIDRDYPVPELRYDNEVLVKTQVIGLNPIDWKAPDFGFGIPVLPYIAGRELAGRIVRAPKTDSRLSEGDRVIVISTDYRDLRKAAFQEYVVSSSFNTVRIPESISLQSGATLGVAFVAAALALGICAGVDFSQVADGPNLLKLVRGIGHEKDLPEDIRDECLNGIADEEGALPGDWIALWGGSSTSAIITLQLAHLAGLRVATVVDKAKHGLRLSTHETLRSDLLIDSHDPDRAVDILTSSFRGKLRYALDTRGRESATALARALTPQSSQGSFKRSPLTPPDTPNGKSTPRSHLVGLTGLPKEPASDGLVYHTVPIKLYHEVPEIGEALSRWLERLLVSGLLATPDIVAVEDGLEGINNGLDRMRNGEVSGGKAIVLLDANEP
ncbi:quinone oxidoreductase [Xylariomycetidae sp. FL2044]|nr:quinone oxidoreductase [Xylariomycetidae sp. FL2044]